MTRRRAPLAVALLALAYLLLFSDVLLPWSTRVPSAGDVGVHGLLFEFAARHMARGELPLWNPHVFSGTPALGNPNAMMLYPATLLAVFLPLATAITVSTILHTLLAGAFTYLWTARRGLHPLGGLLAAGMVSFGGPFFARVYAGHLSAIAAMTWSPLLLLAVDELVRRPSAGWVAVGAVAVAMQMLGGHPQWVFYSFLAAGLSALVQLPRAARRAHMLGSLALVVAWGAALAAAETVPMADALGEDVRGAALAFGAASEFSMTWSALLMLLVPHFYGQGAGAAYWGDWLYWETTPFVGVVGLAAAVCGAAYGERRSRRGGGTSRADFPGAGSRQQHAAFRAPLRLDSALRPAALERARAVSVRPLCGDARRRRRRRARPRPASAPCGACGLPRRRPRARRVRGMDLERRFRLAGRIGCGHRGRREASARTARGSHRRDGRWRQRARGAAPACRARTRCGPPGAGPARAGAGDVGLRDAVRRGDERESLGRAPRTAGDDEGLRLSARGVGRPGRGEARGARRDRLGADWCRHVRGGGAPVASSSGRDGDAGPGGAIGVRRVESHVARRATAPHAGARGVLPCASRRLSRPQPDTPQQRHVAREP